MPEHRRVTAAWTASYDDPIALKAGEPLILTGRADIWEGGHRWLWAVAPDGREGWVPDSLVAPGDRARRDYSAAELTVETGQRVEALDATHGWTLCRAEDGAEGWVPDGHLGPP